MSWEKNILGDDFYVIRILCPIWAKGEGALEDAGNEIKNSDSKKALIVTDKVLVDVKLVDVLLKVLDNVGVLYEVFDGTHPNPTKKNVNDGIGSIQNSSHDFVISLWWSLKDMQSILH